MANLNVQLMGAFLQAYDSATNTYKFNFTLNNPLLAANTAQYMPSFAVPQVATVLSLPVATIWAFYLRNTAVTGNITVQQQVTGGALSTAVNSEAILPGGIKLYMQPVESSGGIIAITLSASLPNVTAEILLAA